MDPEVISAARLERGVKIRRRNYKKRIVAKQLNDFAQNTTLHGLRYITDSGLTIVEKIFWLLTFIASVGICFFLIQNVWFKWKTSPVIVTVSEQLVPVRMVPFPSITICPQMKTSLEYYNYSAEEERFNDVYTYHFDNTSYYEGLEKFEDLTILCDVSIYKKMIRPMWLLLFRDYSNATVAKHILEACPLLYDVFVTCIWASEYVPCDDIFKAVFTKEGVCYNMNALAAEELLLKENMHEEYQYLNTSQPAKGWSVLNGYDDKDREPYPKRGRQNGAIPLLTVIMQESTIYRDKACNTMNTGFKVYIQHPTDYPDSSLYPYALTPNHASAVAVRYNMMTTSDNLRSYSPKIRQCYFPEERQLRYFRIYTANNCRLECITNYTFEICHCVAFYMPHELSSRICTYSSMPCVNGVEDLMTSEEMNVTTESEACNCLPACYSVDYDADISRTEFKFDEHLNPNLDTQPESYYENASARYTYSKLDLFFKSPRYISMRRSELFGTTEFLANCGGLLGLFLGFSFLSLIEIFYFITLRLWCTLKRDLRNEKKAENID